MRVLCLVLRMIGTAEIFERGDLFNPRSGLISGACMRFLLSDVSTIFTSSVGGCLVTKVHLPLMPP